ncbi:MAG: electron transport complex subunit E [Lachnospiraceae bacterium]|jgi:electron transport complex protein RnfE|nr:electron transport complex subunit E [Lachnospiraceae bacterium]
MKESNFKYIINGLIKENPTFVLMLGMCPTMAVTTAAMNGLGMGLSTTVVLILSNMMISALRKVIPDTVRMPAYIVVVASFVTIVQFLLQAFVPSLYAALGLYIPLIVVNCIILGRAESFASKNGVIASMCDGIGMGLGFTVALTLIAMVREFFGTGTIFGVDVIKHLGYEPISILVLAPGAFLVLSVLTALQNKLKAPSATNVPKGDAIACGGNCFSCADSGCASNHKKLADAKEAAKAAKEAEKAAKAAEAEAQKTE